MLGRPEAGSGSGLLLSEEAGHVIQGRGKSELADHTLVFATIEFRMKCVISSVPKAVFLILLSASVAITQAQLTAAPPVDRTTCYAIPASSVSSTDVTEPPSIQTPDQSVPNDSSAWRNYLRLWKEVRDEPDNTVLRRYLGLQSDHQIKVRRGRSSLQSLGWKAGSYQQIDTNHITIYSKADRQVSTQVAQALEQCYWVWTQMFFPLWEAAPQVAGHLGNMPTDQTANDLLSKTSKRITIRRRLKVVLFRDSQQYIGALQRDNPGIGQSTGFYSEDQRAMFLIGNPLDLPTLRHELVHQLFREATPSGLGRDQSPGAQRDFWLVEGIAGYFESMSVLPDGSVTLGGWDSPRLQFARYRVLSGRDEMPIEELRRDGKLSAQSRDDLPRWYAHAIARTHQLLDSGDQNSRLWVYQKLADLYEINAGLKSTGDAMPAERSLREFLNIDDEHLRRNPPTRALQQLCLARTAVTANGVRSLPVSAGLSWLDLSGMPVDASDVIHLVPQPNSLDQLSLEATSVDDDLAAWLKQASSLGEVDLSWTKAGDQTIRSLAAAKHLSTLWVTGTAVSDASVDVIAGHDRFVTCRPSANQSQRRRHQQSEAKTSPVDREPTDPGRAVGETPCNKATQN